MSPRLFICPINQNPVAEKAPAIHDVFFTEGREPLQCPGRPQSRQFQVQGTSRAARLGDYIQKTRRCYALCNLYLFHQISQGGGDSHGEYCQVLAGLGRRIDFLVENEVAGWSMTREARRL